MPRPEDLEILEVIILMGEKRYRVRIKDTNIVFNVHADDKDEAIGKTMELIKRVGLTDEVLSKLKSRA